MKLLGSQSSPFVRKVRMVMMEKKLDFQMVDENVWSADSTIANYNPLSQVPCLIMDEDEVYFDSRVIVEYLDSMSPVGKLIPIYAKEKAQVKVWEAVADGLIDAAILIRLENNPTFRQTDQQSKAWLERQNDKIKNSLDFMEGRLSNTPYCCTAFTLADIAVGCALGYLVFRFPDWAWVTQYPRLAKLYQKLETRASFNETQPV